ncbi:hypothetical protein Cgig2_007624 [Carnegiea gigantea]|uniref:Cytochrome P450 n=1 Tax=Carnegiea gigantea TaxID=171969 RepID=A0A9Q1GTD0_9CARY|nr:hypothetical protein Cgig2_007624 [Carnegiea gigantea]
MWTSIDESISKDGKASILFPLQKCLFTFLSKSIVGADPASYSPKLAQSGSIMLDKWLALQLLPAIHINAFQPLVEIFLHSFSYPFWLVKGDYEQLTDFVAQEGTESHDAAFEVKRGELLCGYQKLAMMDPKVFYDPETFHPDRFVGEKGQELLNYLYWSNGPQTGEPSPSNKQCPGMKSVILIACLLVAHLFQRYDCLKIDSSGSMVAAEKAK